MHARFDRRLLLIPLMFLCSGLVQADPLLAPETFLLREGNKPSISGDGNWVAYECNSRKALCLSDTVTRTTEILATVSGQALIQYADISRDGMVIAYWLRPASNGSEQLFVYDRNTQSTELVSVNSDEVPGSLGGAGNVSSLYSEPHINGDGRYVVFSSYAKNLVENDTNDFSDVFLRDRLLGVTTRISLSSTGMQGDDDSSKWGDPPSISADGNRIIFYSRAENLTPGDISDDLDPYGYGYQDAFLVNVSEGIIVRLSEKPGTSIGGNSYSEGSVAISPNGQFASFQTDADNLYTGVHSGGYDLVLYSAQDYSLTHVNKPLPQSTPQIDTTLEICKPDFNYAGDRLFFCAFASNLVAGDSEPGDDIFEYRDDVLTMIRPLINEAPISVTYPSSNDLGDVLAFVTGDQMIGIFIRGDLTPPVLLEFTLIPSGPVLQGVLLELEALASDVNYGETDILTAEYKLDDGAWVPLTAFDGAFDSKFERVQGFLNTAALALGVHTVCARTQDAAGLTSSENCQEFDLVDTIPEEEFMVMCYHKPLWPQPGETVEIYMKVINADGSDAPVAVQRREVWFNNMALPVVADNSFDSQLDPYTSAALSAGSFSYGCRARQNDTAVFSGWKTVAVGFPDAGEAIPVVFTGASSNRIDIVFIADEDSYEGPDDPVFLDDVENLISAGYYTLPVFNQHQHLINFWLARTTGIADGYTSADGCLLTKPIDWDENYAFADAGAVIHTDNLRDCANKSMFSIEPYSLRVVRHETGHKPFGLADEYCCDGGYYEQGFLPNVYESIEACEADAPDLGRAADACRSWVSTRNDNTYFTSDPGGNDLMIDNRTPNAADIRRILWIFEQTATQSD